MFAKAKKYKPRVEDDLPCSGRTGAQESSACRYAPRFSLAATFFSGFLAAACNYKKKSSRRRTFFKGTRAGARTPDPLIKSQLLYQLSYARSRLF